MTVTADVSEAPEPSMDGGENFPLPSVGLGSR